MSVINRREFLLSAAVGMAALSATAAEAAPKRRFTLCLACGPIGVPGDPRKAIALATQYGFESIEPSAGFLAKLSDGELKDYLEQMKAASPAQQEWMHAGEVELF